MKEQTSDQLACPGAGLGALSVMRVRRRHFVEKRPGAIRRKI
jgi:hypothetical protein